MSYQVIARKWRPQAFDEVTGQEHITQTLRNAIEHDRLHHAYLFSGARGVGKTTTARLLAKALNCHKAEKPTVSPCRSDAADPCPSCAEIADSRSIDVLEFDAASNTQVDKIRDIILEGINVRPARDRNKIFIIDEVHMLSTSSFNALLKTLEEPPPNVVFIMATTEYHKVPETITSRCQEFRFRTISKRKIFERLRLIADADGVRVSDDALEEIARSGEGSMRDAQSNLDQVISFSGDEIVTSDVLAALGMAGTDTLVRAVRSVADRQPRVALEVVDELVSSGQDLRTFCRDLLSLIRDLMVFKLASDGEGLLDLSLVSIDILNELSGPFSEPDLIRLFNAIADTEARLKDSTQPRYTLELGLVKMTEMRRLADIGTLIERLGRLSIPSESSAAEPEAVFAAPASTPEIRRTEEEDEEKKTPAADIPDSFVTDEDCGSPEGPSEPIFEDPHDLLEPPIYDDVPPPDHPEIPDFISNDSLTELPLKLEPLTSKELDHVDDERLDDAYEAALLRTGDSLGPIPDAPLLVAKLLGRSPSAQIVGGPGGAASAVAPARDLSRFAPPVIEEDNDPVDPIELSPVPSEEELKLYARSLPAVRRLMRIFRAEIAEVKHVP